MVWGLRCLCVMRGRLFIGEVVGLDARGRVICDGYTEVLGTLL